MDSTSFIAGKFNTQFIEDRFILNSQESRERGRAAAVAATLLAHQQRQADLDAIGIGRTGRLRPGVITGGARRSSDEWPDQRDAASEPRAECSPDESGELPCRYSTTVNAETMSLEVTGPTGETAVSHRRLPHVG